MDRCYFPSQWLVPVANITPHIYCCSRSRNYCYNMQSIVLHDVSGALRNVCIGTRYSRIFRDMVLVTFLPIPFWVHGSIHLTIVCILSTEVDACHIWTHALPMVPLGPNIPGSNGCILLLLAWPLKGFIYSVNMLPALRAVSCLAVIAIWHINLPHHHLLGNYPKVS
jgi:hypothetical protein